MATAGDIHRSNDGDRVLYTDRPCAAGTQVVAVAGLTPVAAQPPVTLTSTQEIPVTLGMSLEDVHARLGRPYATIARLADRALVEDWIYRVPGATTRIVFEQGRVTGVTLR